MDDQGIVRLYFARSEQAIQETDATYGGYCYSIAYNILSNARIPKKASVIPTYLHGMPFHRENRFPLHRFWEKWSAIFP